MRIGMGVMLNMLFGNEASVDAFTAALNKTITALWLGDDDALHFKFEDGSKMKLFDDGQRCCEHRYMQTDDDLSYFIGAELIGAETKSAPHQEDEYGNVHEVQFLEVKTSKGCFTMASHNEHNGYYGGFYTKAECEE